MTVKRQIAHLIEKLSGNLVIPPSDVYSLPERMHLTKLFDYLEVDCIFDVGANHGQYARMLREDIGYRGHIISYEPIPELAEQLSLRQKTSRDEKWHIERRALDHEAGPAIFHIAVTDQFSSLRTPDPDQPIRFEYQNKIMRIVTVDRSTIAIELPKWQSQLGIKRPFLKLDTQGNDLAVVEGAGAMLDRFVGLQTELSIQRLYEGAPIFAETLSALQALGFEPSAFVPNNNAHFPQMYEVDCILYNVNAIRPRAER